MLQTLKIRSFAIIKDTCIDFESGFNILSGETGAGKSIVIDAISLLLGGRSSEEDIRTGDEEAQIEGIFELENLSPVYDLLKSAGFEFNENTLSIRRTISRKGKNRIFINDTSATLGLIQEIGKYLVDICAQNENRFLMNPASHVDIIDSYGSLEDKAKEFREYFVKYSEHLNKIENLERKNTQVKEKADFLKFIVKEIKGLNLKEGESQELREQKKRLQNSEKLKILAESSYGRILSSDNSVVDGIRNASRDIDSLKSIDSYFDKKLFDLTDTIDRLDDLANEIKVYIDNLEFDETKLEDIKERLDSITKIERKYGSVEQAMERLKQAQEEISALENFDLEMKDLLKKKGEIEEQISDKAKKLSSLRNKKSSLMDKRVNTELASISMENARFLTRIETFDMENMKKDVFSAKDITVSKKGMDDIEFYISTNVGEKPKPLEHIASLGELSRIMLALKGVFYEKNSAIKTFIFDEIDTGIGGKVAEMVGKKLKNLSENKQVICVTHLSQIASYADHHYFIMKNVKFGRTYFNVEKLNEKGRRDELARMIGGVDITDKTKQLAEELLNR